MAIYHLSVKTLSRAKGRSATAAAAYRAGVRLEDDRTGLVFDYRRRSGVEHTELVLPEGAPAWDRATLWNAAERAETRKNSTVAREFELALPAELPAAARQRLARTLARAIVAQHGCAVDVAVHAPSPKGDERNWHAHLLLTTRRLGPEGLGEKTRELDDRHSGPELIGHWRQRWAELVNEALAEHGLEARVDHRSLDAQGIERLPQIHLGPQVLEMETRGVRTDRGALALQIDAMNDELLDLIAYKEALDAERTRTLEARAQSRSSGSGDRTAGTGPGGPGRGDEAGPGRTGRSEQGTSPGLERGPAPGGRGDAGVGQGAEDGRGTRPEGGALDRAGLAGADDAALAPVGRYRQRYGGSRDRLVDLARPALVAGGGGPDRTALAVRRQLEAMGCERFEVGIRAPDGKMRIRTWTKDEVLEALPWLKRQNALGADLYVRPTGEQSAGLVLLDDLTQSQLARLEADGLEPALVVETSLLNYQAWIRLSDKPLEPEIATLLAKTLAKAYDADPNSADWRHFGRLAGFTNRKPEHRRPDGRCPWVLCHGARGRLARRGPELVQHALQQRDAARDAAERARRLDAARTLEDGRIFGRDPDPVREYRRQLKVLLARYGEHLDVSRADYMIVRDMARRGYAADQIRQALLEASPDLAHRKSGHVEDYVARTVRKVMEEEEKKRQSQASAQRGRGGMER